MVFGALSVLSLVVLGFGWVPFWLCGVLSNVGLGFDFLVCALVADCVDLLIVVFDTSSGCGGWWFLWVCSGLADIRFLVLVGYGFLDLVSALALMVA